MKKKRPARQRRPKNPQPVHPRHVQPPHTELEPMTTKPRRAKQRTPLINRRVIVFLLIFFMGFGYEFWRKDRSLSQVTEYGEILVASLCADHSSPPLPGFSKDLFAALTRDQWSCDTQTTIGARRRNKYRPDTVELVLSRPGQSLQIHIRLAMSPPSRDLRYHSYYATAGDTRQVVNYP